MQRHVFYWNSVVEFQIFVVWRLVEIYIASFKIECRDNQWSQAFAKKPVTEVLVEGVPQCC